MQVFSKYPMLVPPLEYNASKLLTKDIVDHIISQNKEYKPNKERISEIKNNIIKGMKILI